jgi:sugar phosphate isomerase/epimerase
MSVAGGLIAAAAPSLRAAKLKYPIGFQTFELIAHLQEDWQGTWSKMAGYGYKYADMVQFRGPLAKYTAQDIHKTLGDVGLYATNGHFSYQSFTEQYGATIEYAHAMEFKTVVCAVGPRRKTVDDWKWMADQLNQIGEKVQKDGLQLAFHNHEIEFVKIDGQMPWDILMENTDPKLVKAQLDVGNLTFGGGNAVETLTKYQSRVFSLHCKDFSPGKASVPVGKGILDWRTILRIATKAGISNYCTEVGAYGVATLDGQPLEPSNLDVIESFRQSLVFLQEFDGI